jgi:hypothetical protein
MARVGRKVALEPQGREMPADGRVDRIRRGLAVMPGPPIR